MGEVSLLNQRTDHELLSAFVTRRCEASFTELVRRYAGLVHGAALRTLDDPELKDDVAQLTFLQLAKRASQLAQNDNLAGWLHCTAYQKALNLNRSHRRSRAALKNLNDDMAMAQNSEVETIWREIAPGLDRELQKLPKTDQTLLIKRFFCGCTVKEAAAHEGISQAAAEKRLQRCLLRLRSRLSDQSELALSTLTAALLFGSAQSAKSATSGAAIWAAAAVKSIPAASGLLSQFTFFLLMKKVILFSALLGTAFIFWPRDEAPEKTTEPLVRVNLSGDRNEPRENPKSHDRFRELATAAEKLSDEELWTGIQKEWDALPTRSKEGREVWLTMMLRELGKRHGKEALVMLKELDSSDRKSEFSEARLATLSGWSLNNPAGAGEAILQGEEQITIFGARPDMEWEKTLSRIAKEVFRNWAKADPDTAIARLYADRPNDAEARTQSWAGIFIATKADPTAKNPEAPRLKSDRESIGGYLGAVETRALSIEDALKHSRDFENKLWQAMSRTEGSPNGSFRTNTLLKELGREKPEEMRRVLKNDSELSSSQRIELVKAIAERDTDYLGLVQATPQKEQEMMMEMLMDLSNPLPTDTAWPVNGRENSAPKFFERIEAIRTAIQEGPFSESRRDFFADDFEQRLRRSSHAIVSPGIKAIK